MPVSNTRTLHPEFAQLVELVEAGNAGADDDRVKIGGGICLTLCATACENGHIAHRFSRAIADSPLTPQREGEGPSQQETGGSVVQD